jgi:hypothetical protein
MLEDKRSHDEYGGIEYGGLPAKTIFGIMLCPNVNAARSKYNWQVSQSVLHPTESTAESQRSGQLQTFHRRLGEPPLLWEC